MTQESHDQNFKNLFVDFPVEALDWILPKAQQDWGKVWNVQFVRQEQLKHKLNDSHVVLDIPILYNFKRNKVMLWLVEFQDDKDHFSIYTVLHYLTDLMEAYPNMLIIPTVIFTDRKKWREDVKRQLEMKLYDRLLLHFEYVFIKLFNYNARDYFHIPNPVVKILLPKMNYEPHERIEVIRQAYFGLYQLASPALFEKYLYFIDVYAEVQEKERETIYQEIKGKKETAMLAQYMKDKGVEEGVQQGVLQGSAILLSRQMARKYDLSPEGLSAQLEGLKSEELLDLGDRIIDLDSFDEIQQWIRERKQKNIVH